LELARVAGDHSFERPLARARDPHHREACDEPRRLTLVVLRDTTERHRLDAPFDPEHRHRLAVHPDVVYVVGEEERRASARQTLGVLPRREAPAGHRGVVPADTFDPRLLRVGVGVRADAGLQLVERGGA